MQERRGQPAPHTSRLPEALGERHSGIDLVVVTSTGVIRRALPPYGDLVLGRDGEHADVVINEPNVSRCHAALCVREGVASVRDLGSTNGTRIAGRSVGPTDTELRLHQPLEVGSTIVVLKPRAPEVRRMQDFFLDPECSNTIRVLSLVHHAVDADCPALLHGEPGVGKTTTARLIHSLSGRRMGPLEFFDCRTFTLAQQAVGLFGELCGSIPRAGVLERSRGGTVVLENISGLHESIQARLVGALTDRRYYRESGGTPLSLDARILTTSVPGPRSLLGLRLVSHEFIRCISRLSISLPALRDRRGEFDPLARRVMEDACVRAGRGTPVELGADAMLVLRSHPWGGNLSELRDVLMHAAVVARGREVRPQDLGLATSGETSTQPNEKLESDRERIVRALHDAGGNQTRAAKLLGVARGTLVSRLDKYGIPRPQKR